MTKNYMITAPRERNSVEIVQWLQWFYENDIHKWVIAQETGNQGRRHWQIRLNCRYSWEELHLLHPNAHIEECSDTWQYERKEGKFFSSEDTPETLQCRYGKPSEMQQAVIDVLEEQSVREVLVWCDTVGNIGKSWLAIHLFEIGKAFYVPPTIDTVKGLIQFIASGYNKEEVIVIDIPRSWKWSPQLYTAIESIKDGMVYDTRYHSTLRNIRGVKVLVLCNEKPKLDKLSKDRWVLV